MQTLRVRQVPWTNPVGRGLREALRAETDRGQVSSTSAGTEDDGVGVVVFLIVYERATGAPVGCGGLRRGADGSTDVDHLYVLPYARWSGVSYAITEALASWALEHGIAGAERTLAQPGVLRP